MKLRNLILVLILASQFWPSFAFNPANPYWMNLKSKLTKHLNKTINQSEYKYNVIGPTKEMTNFLGNRTDANVQFERLNLDSPSPRKSIIAVAYDTAGKRIDSVAISLEFWVYRNVYKLRNTVSTRDEIHKDNVYESKVAIRQMDEKLYYHGRVKQKVATTNISANTPLKVNMIRHEKLIQIGDMINIRSGSQFVTLEFICKAMTSGDVGDTITINCQNMQNKTMKASITGDGTAKLI